MGEGWQLLKIGGIPLRIQPSWLFAVVLFTVIFQSDYAGSTGVDPAQSWGFGLLTTLLLFTSVLLHELGHALMALREGIKVQSITLFHLGGIARMEKECPSPMGYLRIAAAGPMVSLLLAITMLLAGGALTDDQSLLATLFTQVGSLNLLLGLFNLLPGLPLDGGLILKALVWKISGSRQRGVQVASASGRALSILMIVMGGLILWRGGGFFGVMLMLIGWFGLGANRSHTQITMLQKLLRDLHVEASAGRRFRVLEADQPLRRLSQLRLQESEVAGIADWVLICRSGRWIGWVDDRPLRDLPVQQWDQQKLEDHIKPLDDLPSIASKAPLFEAVEQLESSPQGRLLVLSPAGLPVATIDRINVAEGVLKQLGVSLPAAVLTAARQQNTYPMGMMMLPQVVASMRAQNVEEEPR